MKKITIKILMVLLTILVLLSTISYGKFSVGDITGTTGDSSLRIRSVGGQIITVLSTVGSIMSVVVLVILGIKYMLGSVEEKAEYKRTLLPYVIGASFVFGASTIASVIYNIAK